jgi:hypothetical protein
MTKTDVLESLGFKRHLKGYAMPLQGLCRRYIELRGWTLIGVFERGETFGDRRPSMLYFKKGKQKLIFHPESYRVVIHGQREYYCPDIQSFIKLERSVVEY